MFKNVCVVEIYFNFTQITRRMNMCSLVQYLELSVLWLSLMFMICGQVAFSYILYINIFYMCKNKCLWRIHKIKFKYLAKSSTDIYLHSL